MSKYKLAIFDLDGVIVDTAKYHFLAWKDLANKLGSNFTEADNERLKGVSRWRSLDILLEVGGLTGKFTEEEKSEMAESKNNLYVSYIKKLRQDEILPGARELIQLMRSQGMKTAIGSASKNTPLILERLNLTDPFDIIVDGNNTQKAKPDPEVFTLAADALGVKYTDCLVFEDSQAGIDAALCVGMSVVGVGSPDNLKGALLCVDGLDAFSLHQVDR